MEISALIALLQDPRIYPDPPVKVELVQTHISAIFLSGKHAYKIKKPVNFGFLDFTTLEKHKFYCQQEVELNRRLCPEVYLGILEIRTHQGKMILGEGPGEVREYAVFMKPLPQDCTMDRWLSRGAIPLDLLKKIAEKIAHLEKLLGDIFTPLLKRAGREIVRFGAGGAKKFPEKGANQCRT